MDSNKEMVNDFLSRYFLIVLIVLFSEFLFLALLPLTIYPVFWILNLLGQASMTGNIIMASGKEIEIIRACVGSSAVLLLIALNLSTRNIGIVKRIKLVTIGIISFLIFNWIRILALSALFLSGIIYFDQLHLVSWYAVSTIAVAGIWVFSAEYFKIKEIPFASDIKHLYSLANKIAE